jgi:hypothetical protein
MNVKITPEKRKQIFEVISDEDFIWCGDVMKWLAAYDHDVFLYMLKVEELEDEVERLKGKSCISGGQ